MAEVHFVNTLVVGGTGMLAEASRFIRVHGSDSKGPKQIANRQTVILGWVNEPAGRRWLSNTEISGGVIEAVRNPFEQIIVVGSLND